MPVPFIPPLRTLQCESSLGALLGVLEVWANRFPCLSSSGVQAGTLLALHPPLKTPVLGLGGLLLGWRLHTLCLSFSSSPGSPAASLALPAGISAPPSLAPPSPRFARLADVSLTPPSMSPPILAHKAPCVTSAEDEPRRAREPAKQKAKHMSSLLMFTGENITWHHRRQGHVVSDLLLGSQLLMVLQLQCAQGGHPSTPEMEVPAPVPGSSPHGPSLVLG